MTRGGSVVLPAQECRSILKVAPKKHNPELDSAKVNAPAELLRGQTKSQNSEWPACQRMWPLLKEHPQPSWGIVAQRLFPAELDVILQVGEAQAQTPTSKHGRRWQDISTPTPYHDYLTMGAISLKIPLSRICALLPGTSRCLEGLHFLV